MDLYIVDWSGALHTSRWHKAWSLSSPLSYKISRPISDVTILCIYRSEGVPRHVVLDCPHGVARKKSRADVSPIFLIESSHIRSYRLVDRWENCMYHIHGHVGSSILDSKSMSVSRPYWRFRNQNYVSTLRHFSSVLYLSVDLAVC